MARITILGAGIIGMSIASTLSRRHSVTIIARDIPGDAPSTEWASPWAGASFIFGGCDNQREMQMQLDAFVELWRMGIAYPESGIKQISINDVFDEKKENKDIWWKEHVPEFRWMKKNGLPTGAKCGISYKTLVMDPNVFLLWFKRHLESTGVTFKRMHLNALKDADTLGHDALVNASGFGSKFLRDIQDGNVEMIRGQTIVVRSNYNTYFMRDNGKTYTYAIPRGDGTVVLGGVRDWGSSNPKPDSATTEDILRRLNYNLPDVFSSDPSDHDIVGYNVGFRPGRKGGIRVERDSIKKNVVHTYGFSGGGYIYSFGAAREAVKFVEEILFPTLHAKL